MCAKVFSLRSIRQDRGCSPFPIFWVLYFHLVGGEERMEMKLASIDVVDIGSAKVTAI